MFRIDFGCSMLENAEEVLFACVGLGLHTKLRFLRMQLYSYVWWYVLEILCTWGWACVRGVLFTYVGFDPHMWDSWQKPYFTHFHLFLSFCTWISLYPSFYLHSCTENIIFMISAWIKNLMSFSSFFLFCSHHPLMLVGEALIRWWNGTTFLPLKLGPTSERWASSPSLVFFQRGLRVLPWCSA